LTATANQEQNVRDFRYSVPCAGYNVPEFRWEWEVVFVGDDSGYQTKEILRDGFRPEVGK